MYENKVEDILKAQSGNKEIMTKLVTENSNLIWSIVTRFKDRGYEIEDLYQIGCIGFIKSIKRFDTNYEVKLSTYAVPYILGEIKRFIRDDGIIKVSRGLKETAFKAMKAREILIMNGNKEPTIDEIAEYINIDKETIILSMNASQEVDSIDRNLSNDKGKEINVIDTIVSEDDKSEKIVNNILLKQTLKKLEDKEKMIITMRYIEELTQSQVAKKIGVSQVQVSRLEKKILLKMREYMAS